MSDKWSSENQEGVGIPRVTDKESPEHWESQSLQEVTDDEGPELQGFPEAGGSPALAQGYTQFEGS